MLAVKKGIDYLRSSPTFAYALAILEFSEPKESFICKILRLGAAVSVLLALIAGLENRVSSAMEGTGLIFLGGSVLTVDLKMSSLFDSQVNEPMVNKRQRN